jgi:plasmid stabilization system protein ParE
MDRSTRPHFEAPRPHVKGLRLVPEAEEELAEAAAWYETRRPGLGVELVMIVERALEEISDAPLAWALWRDDRPYRRKVLGRFPYVIFFRIDPDAIVVLAIAHAKRRPGYWSERLPRGA